MLMAFPRRICQGRPVADAASPTTLLSGKRVLLAMLGILGLAIGILFVAHWLREPDPVLDDHGVLPDFSFTDETGATFTQEALRGHPTIFTFIFTRCPDICPMIAGRAERLQEKTQDRKGVAIKIVSISVDPDHDTPAALTEFAARYHADPTRWKFIVGPWEKTKELVTSAMKNEMERGPTLGLVTHQGYFVLVDGDLHVRGFYDSNEPQRLDDLIRHARFLARTGSGRSYKFGGN
jgi:protein SCO1